MRICRSKHSSGIIALFLIGATVLTLGATPATAATGGSDGKGGSIWGAGYFPDTRLVTQEGKSMRFFTDLLKGKVVAISFFSTRGSAETGFETARLREVQKILGDRVGRDVFIYSISIDPEHDTPKVLKEYAEKFQAGPGWLFLTGKEADVTQLRKKLGLYRGEKVDKLEDYETRLIIGNQSTGQWMKLSHFENPYILATKLGTWLSNWAAAPQEPANYANAPKLREESLGEGLFRNACAACHTIGGGDAIGPDLKGVTAAREPQWLRRFIATPEKLLDEHDPIATSLLARFKQVRMPNLSLGDADAALLVDYLARENGEHVAPAPTAPMRSMGAMPDGAPHAAASPRPSAKTSVSPADFGTLLDPYLRIQEALAHDSFEGVSDSALALATAAMKLGSRGAAVKAAVNPFAQAGDVVAARAAFGGVSEAVLRLAGASGLTLEGRAAVAYCPMARKYWLQKGDTVQNPYYGKQMSDCGRIVSDIPTFNQ